jgi:hypothetical protein
MARSPRRGRGRLSSIELLPPEAGDIVVWAAQELQARERTLTAIYGEFREKLIALQGEQGLAFDIPAFSSFHRYSVFQAALLADMEETRTITQALAERLDGIANENVTVMVIEMIKTVVFQIVRSRSESLKPKDVMELSKAVQMLVASSKASGSQRQEHQKAIDEAASEAIGKAEKVAREAGVSAEAIAQMRREFLGVRPQKPGAALPLDTDP